MFCQYPSILGRSLSLQAWTAVTRNLTTGCTLSSKGRTYESSTVPGSVDHTNPLEWADRLFKLKEARKNYQYDNHPSPILMIARLKPLKGLNFYELSFLEKYGIGSSSKSHKWVLVKNSPSITKELNTIKHLIRVQPVRFLDGLPANTEDLLKYRLLPNGKFVKSGFSPFREGKHLTITASHSKCKDIDTIPSSELSKELLPITGNPLYLTRNYLKQWHNTRFERHQLFSEFFTDQYKYRLNQDGQEYRYNKLWRLDDAMRQSLRQRKNADGTYKARNNSRFEADWNTYPWAFY